jgi:hypothetical protein
MGAGRDTGDGTEALDPMPAYVMTFSDAERPPEVIDADDVCPEGSSLVFTAGQGGWPKS